MIKKYTGSARNAHDSLRAEVSSGTIATKQKYYVYGINKLWFCTISMTNVLLSAAVGKYRATLGSRKKKPIRVYFPHKIVKFKELKNRLWLLIPSDEYFYVEHP